MIDEINRLVHDGTRHLLITYFYLDLEEDEKFYKLQLYKILLIEESSTFIPYPKTMIATCQEDREIERETSP